MPPVPGTKHSSEQFQRRGCLRTWLDFATSDGNVLGSDIVGPKRENTCPVKVWSVVSVSHIAGCYEESDHAQFLLIYLGQILVHGVEQYSFLAGGTRASQELPHTKKCSDSRGSVRGSGVVSGTI